MDKKGAIALSMNMIVMIILSLVIFAGGMLLLRSFVTGAEEIQGDIDQQTQDQLNSLLTEQGQRVAFPFYTKTVKRGNSHVFGIGISNIETSDLTFGVRVNFVKLITLDGTQIIEDPGGVMLEYIRYDRENFIIKSGGIVKKSIVAVLPNNVLSGTYVYDAQVFSYSPNGESLSYGNKQKFFVTVP